MAEMVLKVKHTEGKETKIGVEMRSGELILSHLSGKMLTVKQVALALMAYGETYRAIREYAKKDRKWKFDVLEKEKEIGMSTDSSLLVYKYIDGYCVPTVMAKCHITQEDKLHQEGCRMWTGYAGDLVEFMRYYDRDCDDIFSLEMPEKEKEVWYQETEECTLGVYGVESIEVCSPFRCPKETMKKFKV